MQNLQVRLYFFYLQVQNLQYDTQYLKIEYFTFIYVNHVIKTNLINTRTILRQ